MFVILENGIKPGKTFTRRNSSQAKVLACIKFYIWCTYLFIPFSSCLFVFMGFDPTHRIFDFIFKTFPPFYKNALRLSFNSKVVLTLGLFCIRLSGLTFVLYEGLRLAFLGVSLAHCGGHVGISLLKMINGLLPKWGKAIVEGKFVRHFSHYRHLMILLRAMENSVQTTATIFLFITACAVVVCTFVAVRLHPLITTLILIVNIGIVVLMVTMTKINLDNLAVLEPMSHNLLQAFKGTNMQLGMTTELRKLTVRIVKSLKPLRIPLGLGSLKFAEIKTCTKSTIMMGMVDSCMNALLANWSMR